MNWMMLAVALCTSLYCLVEMLLRSGPFVAAATGEKLRVRHWVYAGLFLLNTVIMYFILTLGIPSSSVIKNDLLIMSIVSTLVNILLFPGRIREHLFIYGIVSICTYLVNPIATFLTSILVGFNSDMAYLAGSGSYALVMIAVYLPIRLLLKRTVEPFLSMDSRDYWELIWFVPLGLLVAMRLALPWNVSTETGYDLLSRVMFGTVTICICLLIAKDYRRLREHQVMVEQLANQKAHYTMLQQQVEDARRTRHDLKHYIAAIQQYIDTDDKSGLQEYCDELTAGTLEDDRIPYTGNPAADGVLYRYQHLARDQEVEFSYSGRIRSTGIANVDLCVILGNALDNALTACATAPGPRQIQVFAQTEAQLLSIMVRNTFDGQVQTRDGVLLSRKRENEPGVGLGSMQTICDRYGGTLQPQWDEEYFTLLIMLPIQEE